MRKSRTDLRTLCRIQAAGIFSRRLVRDRAHHLAADQPESAEPCVFAPTSQGRAGLSDRKKNVRWINARLLPFQSFGTWTSSR